MIAERPAGAAACAAAVAARELSAAEAVAAALATVGRMDATVRAFTALDAERALADAHALDARLARGEAVGPMAGVPVALKELISVAGLPASYGTAALPVRRSETDATVVRLLRRAGALVIGVTRSAELAWRSDTPPTTNPRFPELIPGGSSGGAAAAVAAEAVGLALGTDTGGSIRWPAVMCGVAGLKPTYGAVSLRGVLPCSYALDSVGPIAHRVADVRLGLAALVAHDPVDPASASPAVLEPLATRLGEPGEARSGLRLGVLEDPSTAFSDARDEQRFDETLDALAGHGARLVTVRIPELRYASPAITAITLADGHRFVPALRERPNAFGREVRCELLLGLALPAALVARAHEVRRILAARVRDCFCDERLDALVLPARTAPARSRAELEEQPDADLGTAALYLASLTGQPAISVPLPQAGDVAPHAVQLVGRPFADDALLDLAALVERDVVGR